MSGLAVGALLITVLVVVAAGARGPGERAAAGRDRRAAERGAVPLAGAALVRRHHRRSEADGAMRFVSPSASRVLRLRSRERSSASRCSSCSIPTIATGPRSFFARRRQLPASRRRWSGASASRDGSLAARRADRHQPAGRPDGARHRAQHPRRERAEAAGGAAPHQAFHDPLTGLANRALFRDRVSHALALAQRAGARRSPCSSSTSTTSRRSTTASATPRATGCWSPRPSGSAACARAADTVARLGGDEFAILIEDVAGADGRDGAGRAARRPRWPSRSR